MAAEKTDFPAIGGEMADRVRGFDWAATPLGPISSWPQSLRTAVGMVLLSPVPIVMLWGQDGIMIYNDAYSVFAGGRHPQLLGSKVREGWPEVAPFNDHVMKVGLAGGTLAYRDHELTLYRTGRPEQVWMNLDYSPMLDESGRPAGVMAIVVETTARVLAERALVESETWFREIADAAPVMIWISDAAASVSWFNKAVLDFTGRPLEAEIGMRWLDHVHPDDSALVAQRFAEAHASQTPVRVIFRARRHDGAWRTLDETAVARFAPGGSFIGFIGSCMDVTEQQSAVETLRESEEKLRLSTESAGIGLWEYDVSTRTGLSQPRVKGMFGMPAETEAAVEEFFALVHPEDRERVTNAFSAALDPEQRATYDVEYQVVGRDGVLRWIAANGRGVFDAQGRCLRVIGTAIDITRRKEIEREVRELNETLERRVAERTQALEQGERNIRTILETSHLSQGLMDVAGTLLYANRTALDGIRARPEDVVGRPLWETQWFATTPGMPETIRAAVERVAAGNTENMGMTLNMPGGTRSFDFSLRPVKDEMGQVVAMVPEGVDTTARVMAEQALQQAQKMEAIGNLTGGIAHDFNNLLQGVTGSLDLIRRKAEDAGRVRRWAEAGLQAAERGAKLTGQLLAFSRSQKLELKPLDLGELLAGMRELLGRTLGPSVRVRMDLEPQLPNVLGDQTQLELAVLNLAINARDAMPEGGDLTISARRANAFGEAALASGDYVQLSVTDSGSGMPPEIAARAFDPFFTTKGVGKGTGLGLSQVYGMARQAGGGARIRSEPGRGTTVSIFLRLTADVAHPQAARQTQFSTGVTHARILVVDDDPDVRRFLSESLTGLGYAVLLASDGNEGLQVLVRERPDLMIVDYAMPGMTGAELARLARARLPEVRIVFASGYADTSAIEKAADSQTPILRKPFRLDELQATVATALRMLRQAHGSTGSP
ncbi:MAG TPA: PAS domain S-box protein [Rhizomicrobium sp.]|jgi:PAS domain S-box-containing protein